MRSVRSSRQHASHRSHSSWWFQQVPLQEQQPWSDGQHQRGCDRGWCLRFCRDGTVLHDEQAPDRGLHRDAA